MCVAISDKDILGVLYRTKYEDKEYYFTDILKSALSTFYSDSSIVDSLASNKETSIWNTIIKQQKDDEDKGIVPLFSIVSESDKKVRWIGDSSPFGVGRDVFLCRPDLYSLVDDFTDREYECFACFICKCLGADKITLTPRGNEGGVDFYARIPFSKDDHFFFGIKGPIRIVGQCKKYSKKDNVIHMKEFKSSLDFVHTCSFRIGETLPSWFRSEKGIIIGWHISNKGHQAGALDIAKAYGIVVSDTKDLIDIACKADILTGIADKAKCIRDKYMNETIYDD
ncbi:MAG: restriction endonuclease [Saccharofermentans sp.]|nr:restriction endonuclease [Saccharofermentans sp.]